jgi:hypothetical protein
MRSLAFSAVMRLYAVTDTGWEEAGLEGNGKDGAGAPAQDERAHQTIAAIKKIGSIRRFDMFIFAPSFPARFLHRVFYTFAQYLSGGI